MAEWVWVFVPVAAIVMWGLRGIAQARAGAGAGDEGRRLRDEVRALREDVERLRQGGGADSALEARLLELEERVDFTERLLARNEPRTPPGS